MQAHRRSPTISDVARRAGVSIATVSRVLNGNPLVIAPTVGRVQAAIKKLHYVPRSAARVLASRKTNAIGLLLPEIGGWFFPPMLRGIESAARQLGFDLLIHTASVTYPLEASKRALGMHNTDGLIVFTKSLEQEELVYLRQNRFPVVLLHQTPSEELDIPVITIENKSGAEKLVEHLVQVHGYRRIAFLKGSEGHEDSEWRERGYREALRRNQIRFDRGLVSRGGFDELQAAEAVRRLLRNGVDFDAIFTGDDDAATGALSALRNAGRRVPDDVAVVGFDDIPLAKYLTPPLTTVRAPLEQVGREAVRQLVKLIQRGHADAITLLPTELVLRESCGCPPQSPHINGLSFIEEVK
ncbi:MAG TPA: LacI family DNA-binding transcriptional regulator [Anaerolineales bacterium]|nr:LacI family DNA-binding transcriptional regulator [Anaerolineales bacterium]